MKQLLCIFLIISSSCLNAQVTISEVLFKAPSWEENFKYFELQNISDETVNLSGWSISGDVDLVTLPDLNLVPNEQYIFCADPLIVLNHGIIMDLAGWGISNSLSDEPIIVLKNPSGDEVVRIEYDADSNWPATEEGVAMELCGPDLDPNVGSNWGLSDNEINTNLVSIFGTPGAENTCIQVSTGDISFSDNIKLFPNPTNSILNIEYSGVIESTIVYNINGNKLQSSSDGNSIDVSGLNNGFYIVCIESNGTKLFQRFVKL